jgi:phospholipase C
MAGTAAATTAAAPGKPRTRRTAARLSALVTAAALTAAGAAAPAFAAPHPGHYGSHTPATATPIKHLVVLFDENVSFDHYFATYPKAANTDGTPFKASPATPAHIDTAAGAGLLKKNPNQYAPQRLTPSQALTCDQNHSYTPEQYAADGGKADQYVQNTDSGKCSGNLYGEPGLVMDYYDGNTVTALWNYAQNYAMSDRYFDSTYGPSTPGALNLVAGQTHGVVSMDATSGTEHPKRTATPDAYAVASPDAKGVGTVVNDPDPAYDDCSDTDHTKASATAALTGRNIGDLLNSRGVSWGWFQGGFRPSTAWHKGDYTDYARCAGTTHANIGGTQVEDYSPHHEPFQYYASTANPHHLAPASTAEIGHNGRANHQYDLTDFDSVLKAGKLPSVSFLKAAEYQDGHAGYSDPTDEQHFLVKEINAIEKSPQWSSTAILVTYDDSDGWYDHAYAPVSNGSKDTATASDGKATDSPACQSGPAPAAGQADRCGPGPRLPLLAISPYSRVNSVDHAPLEQASVTRFIEDNWRTGRIGDGSFDKRAGSLAGLFDFARPKAGRVLLGENGAVTSSSRVHAAAAPRAAERLNAADASLTVAAPGLGTGTGTGSGPGTPALAGGLAAVAVLGAAGTWYGLRRRRAVR